LYECEDVHDTKELLHIGKAAWNMAITKQINEESFYEKIITNVEEEIKEPDAINFLKELIDRKMKSFPQYKFIISDIEILEKGRTFGISVAVIQLE
jgi:hypothetical protein